MCFRLFTVLGNVSLFMNHLQLTHTGVKCHVYDDRATVCCGNWLIYVHSNVYETECLLLGTYCDLLLCDLCLN